MSNRCVKLGLFALLLAFSTAAHSSFAQNTLFDPIRDVIKTGSAKEMARFLNQSVDINIEGDVKTYSKPQAEFVFRDFFKKHPPTSFTIVHTGSSKGGLQFAIGRYVSNSDNYSVLMRVKEVGSEYLIHEISFVKE